MATPRTTATAGHGWGAISLLTAEARFLRACRGEAVDRPPVWLMRQAGRYLPEYRKVREGVTFLEMCADVERAVEVSLQPIDLVGSEAVILFSDIFVPILGMEIELDFAPGPIIAEPIREMAQVDALVVSDPTESVPYVFEILRRLRAALTEREIPLVGFAGSPFTLACYMIRGKGDPEHRFAEVTRLAKESPDILDALLEKLAELTAAYLLAQIDAGAQAVQLFDTWARVLDERQYRRFVLPLVKRIAAAVKGKAPFILFGGEAPHLARAMLESDCDVFSAGESVSLSQLVEISGGRVSLQGNLAPEDLKLSREAIFDRVREMAREARGARGYIANLGHGCTPETPVAGVKAFTDAARALGAS